MEKFDTKRVLSLIRCCKPPLRLAPWRVCLVIVVLIILLSGARLLAEEPANSSSGAVMDYVAYWAAARLLLNGDNPYSPTSLLHLQQKVGLQGTEPLMMWNPPWTFILTLPFGFFDFSVSQFLWFVLNVFAVLFSSHQLWRIYTGSTVYSRMPWLLALTFFPNILVLIFGQISPLILLGLTTFVCFVQRQKWIAAGAALVIVSVKPHFVYLFWIALFLWICQRGRWRILLGAGLAWLLAAILPLIIDPAVYSQYVELYSRAPLRMPLDLPAPTLRNVLKVFTPVDSAVVEYLPTMAGIGWMLFYWLRHKDQWEWAEQLPLILLVSIVTSAYTWSFDQVVFLPAIFQGAAWVRGRRVGWYGKAAVVFYGGIDIFYLTMKFVVVNDFWYFWMAPAYLANYLVLRKESSSANIREV